MAKKNKSQELSELFPHIKSFRLNSTKMDSGWSGLSIDIIKTSTEPVRWGVFSSGDVLMKKEQGGYWFQYSGMPSSRSDDYLKKARFSTLKEAVEAVLPIRTEIIQGYITNCQTFIEKFKDDENRKSEIPNYYRWLEDLEVELARDFSILKELDYNEKG